MAVKREQVVQTAEKYVARGKIEPAIREYRKLLEENPNDINTLNRVGDLYARIQRIDEAVDFFNQIAEQYAGEGFFVKAIAIYKKIIKLDPTRLDVYENLAELYHRQGLVTEARTQYQVLADYYQKHENATSTIAIYQKMAELEPDNPTYHVKLAELFQQQQLIEKAMGEYKIIAELMMQHGHPQEAAQVYERALAIDSTNLAFITDAALKLQEAAGPAVAARFLAAACERNPQASQVARLIGGPPSPGAGMSGTHAGVAPVARAYPAPAVDAEAAERWPPPPPQAAEPAVRPTAQPTAQPPTRPTAQPPARPEAQPAARPPEPPPRRPVPAPVAEPRPAQPPVASAPPPAAAGADEDLEFEIDLGADLVLDEDLTALPAGPGPAPLQRPGAPPSAPPASGYGREQGFEIEEAGGLAADSGPTGGVAEPGEAEDVFVLDIENDDEPASLFKPPPDMLREPKRPPWAQAPPAAAASPAAGTDDGTAWVVEPELPRELPSLPEARPSPEVVEAAEFLDLDLVNPFAAFDDEAAPAQAAHGAMPGPASDLSSWGPAPGQEAAFGAVPDADAAWAGGPAAAAGPGAFTGDQDDQGFPGFAGGGGGELASPFAAGGAVQIDSDLPGVPRVAAAAADLPGVPRVAAAAADLPGVPRLARAAADLLERTAAELQPQATERYEDLVSEAEVLAKYGLQDKAAERLRDAMRIKPRQLSAYLLLIQLHLEQGRHARVQELANQVAEITAGSGDRETWPKLRKRLLAAGYRLDGEQVVGVPGAVDGVPGAERDRLRRSPRDGAPQAAAQAGEPVPAADAPQPRAVRPASPPAPAVAGPAAPFAGATDAALPDIDSILSDDLTLPALADLPLADLLPAGGADAAASPRGHGMPDGVAGIAPPALTAADAAPTAAPAPLAPMELLAPMAPLAPLAAHEAIPAPPAADARVAEPLAAPSSAAAAVPGPAGAVPAAAPAPPAAARRPRKAADGGIDQLLKGLVTPARGTRDGKRSVPPAAAVPPPAAAPPPASRAALEAEAPGPGQAPDAWAAAGPPAAATTAPAGGYALDGMGDQAVGQALGAGAVPPPGGPDLSPDDFYQLPELLEIGGAAAPPGLGAEPPGEIFNPLEIGAMVESEEIDWDQEGVPLPGFGAGMPVPGDAGAGGAVGDGFVAAGRDTAGLDGVGMLAMGAMAATAEAGAMNGAGASPAAAAGGHGKAAAGRPRKMPSLAPPPAEQDLDDTGGMSWLDEADSGRDKSAARAASLFDEEEDFFDLAGELEQELSQEADFQDSDLLMQQEQSLEEIVEGFKRGVAEHLSPTDYDTHFNLGIAYREMGLLDEAIGEFQLSAKDPRYLVSCCSMLGLCFLDKGLPELAIKWYRRGLEAQGISEEDTLGLLYDMGCAYLALGDNGGAYKTFVDVYGINTNYRDVVARIEELGHPH